MSRNLNPLATVLAVLLLVACSSVRVPAAEVRLTIDLRDKTAILTNTIAFRELVPTRLVNLGESSAGGLTVRLSDMTGGVYASQSAWTSAIPNDATSILDLNTSEMASWFSNRPPQSVSTFTLGVWDGTLGRLLVNCPIEVQNNPYCPGMPGPSPIGQTYVPEPTNLWIGGAALFSSTTGQTTYAGTIGAGGTVSVVVAGSTNVTASNLLANGGAGVSSATVYRGDWGAAASNLALSSMSVATSAAGVASIASGVATGAWLQAVSASNVAAAAFSVATGAAAAAFSTNVTAGNLLANGGAGVSSATVYRGDWGAAASNLAAVGYSTATVAAATASAAYAAATNAARATNAVAKTGDTMTGELELPRVLLSYTNTLVIRPGLNLLTHWSSTPIEISRTIPTNGAASYDETEADQLILVNTATLTWRRFQLLPDGRWLRLTDFQPAGSNDTISMSDWVYYQSAATNDVIWTLPSDPSENVYASYFASYPNLRGVDLQTLYRSTELWRMYSFGMFVQTIAAGSGITIGRTGGVVTVSATADTNAVAIATNALALATTATSACYTNTGLGEIRFRAGAADRYIFGSSRFNVFVPVALTSRLDGYLWGISNVGAITGASLRVEGTATALGGFVGDGGSLTNFNAANFATGTVCAAIDGRNITNLTGLSGYVSIGNLQNTLTNYLRWTAAPASYSSAGQPGQIAFGASGTNTWLYIWNGTNWPRVRLETW